MTRICRGGGSVPTRCTSMEEDETHADKCLRGSISKARFPIWMLEDGIVHIQS